jgi:hypothetical protein
MEWQWQGKTEGFRENWVPVPLCPPQILHGLVRDSPWTFEIRALYLTTWTVARLFFTLTLVFIHKTALRHKMEDQDNVTSPSDAYLLLHWHFLSSLICHLVPRVLWKRTRFLYLRISEVFLSLMSRILVADVLICYVSFSLLHSSRSLW